MYAIQSLCLENPQIAMTLMPTMSVSSDHNCSYRQNVAESVVGGGEVLLAGRK